MNVRACDTWYCIIMSNGEYIIRNRRKQVNHTDFEARFPTFTYRKDCQEVVKSF